MTLKAEDYKIGDPIYTFVDHEGNNIHIDSEKVREWCSKNKDKLEVLLTPVDPNIAASFLQDNVIDPEHAIRVLRMPKLDPIIYGHTGTYGKNGGPDVILIDGHHRFFAAYLAKCEMVPAYILSQEQWKEFEILGMPDVTEEELKRMPTKFRR